MNPEHNKMEQNILERIRKHELRMKPRTYFLLKIVGTALVAGAALLISIAILNFVSFSIRINAHDTLFGFGPRGFLTFLRLFPWPLFIADILLVFVLERLLRNFKWGYRMPILYLFLLLIGVSTVSAAVLDHDTPINDNIFQAARAHKLPGPINDFYMNIRKPLDPDEGACRCKIVSVGEDDIKVVNPDSTSSPVYTVVLPSQYTDDKDTLKVGDTLFVAGDLEGSSTFRAFGLRHLRKELRGEIDGGRGSDKSEHENERD